MTNVTNTQVAELLSTLQTQTNDPSLRQALQVVGDMLKTGDIIGSTGVAIGRNIRQVINHFDLPPEAAVALLDLRTLLGTSLGLDTSRYQWDILVTEKIRDFVGREFVFQAIDQFISENTSGYFTIEADPGIGKSSILAEYVRRTGCLAHFNVRALGITGAAQFLQNICAQIIADAQLPYTHLPVEATQDGAFLLKLLREAAQKLEPGDRLVIAVDALDEVDLSTHPAGANILFLPTTLPEGVYFIMTRRQVEVPFIAQAVQELLDLMTFPAENRKDVEFYLGKSAERPKLQEWIDAQNLGLEAFVKAMADLSENNFMYLRYVLPDIEKGAYKELSISGLPQGLKKYYEDHWRQMGMKAKPLPRVRLRIIYILSEVRQPVSRQLITEFADNEELHVDELMVQEVLDDWEQFLHEQQTPDGKKYSVYHASFRDFLNRKDVVQAADVTIREINALIADSLWNDLFGQEG
jgi:hypothetical protein